jgi:chromosome partitioning protein
VLAHLGTGRQDAAVTDPDDRAQRSRAIFEQLRSAEPAEESSGEEPDLIGRTDPANPVDSDTWVTTSDLSPSVRDPLDQPATTQEPSIDHGSTGEGADSPVAIDDDGPSVGEEEPAAATPDPIPPPEAPAAAPSEAASSTPTGPAIPSAGPAAGPLPGTSDLGAFEALINGSPAPAAPGGAAPEGAAPNPTMPANSETAVPDSVADAPALATSGISTTPSVATASPGSTDSPTEPDRATVGEPPTSSHFARALPRVMAVANQKGGVGKTTTAVNLGACLADLGYRVLVVDLDPQGNASTGLGINIRDLQGSMYEVILHDLPIEDCVEATSVRNLFCAPSSLDLAGAEIELVPAFSRELRLKRALEEVHDDYDFVLIDCPPSLGLLTVNGLAAATEVVVPIQCEYYALEGLGQLLRNVNLVQRNLNPGLEVSAIILVMYDARTKLADQVVTEVRSHFGAKVCRNVVPRTVRLSEAPSFGQPIIAFDPSSRGAIAYRELAKEVSGGTPQRAR